MLDLKGIRKSPDTCEALLRKKDPTISLQPILDLDKDVRNIKTNLESLLAQRKQLSSQIHQAKQHGEDPQSLIDEVDSISSSLKQLETSLEEKNTILLDALSRLPNYPDDDVPVAPDKTGNVVIKSKNDIPQFAFQPKNHLELNQKLQLFDFKFSAKTSRTGGGR